MLRRGEDGKVMRELGELGYTELRKMVRGWKVEGEWEGYRQLAAEVGWAWVPKARRESRRLLVGVLDAAELSQ